MTPGYTPFGFLGSQFAVNDSGRVAYIALQETGSQVLVTIDAPAQPVTVIDTNVGPIRALGAISMNSAGDIVFMGGTVLTSSNMGLYTGPNPATDVIVDGFDSLPGYDSPVFFLDFTHPGVNDAGQVDFQGAAARRHARSSPARTGDDTDDHDDYPFYERRLRRSRESHRGRRPVRALSMRWSPPVTRCSSCRRVVGLEAASSAYAT